MLRSLIALILILTSLTSSANAQSPAPPVSKTTHVLAILRIPPGTGFAEIRKTMPAEIRATVQLYLDGHLAHWYSRSDGRGVIFILNAPSVEVAKALLDELPLVKQHGATFDYIALSPLRPLQILLQP